jgi:hypothetical protein
MKEKKLKWNNLKEMKCPKCSGPLTTANSGTRGVFCKDDIDCNFFMAQPAFDRVIKSLYSGMGSKGYKLKFGDDMDTLNFLNNYGHNEMSADFSGDDSLLDDEE